MRYSFGQCRLDTASRELVLNGSPVHVSPKAFELLCLLIDQRPRVLTKAELMQALWPETFVVEANLPVIVGEVRAALGERSATSSAVKTHHGIGYSFIADVTESRAGIATHDGPQPFLKAGPRRIMLAQGANMVGRDHECDVYLNDVSVSRHHARITVNGDVAVVMDLASKNGTIVHGVKIAGPTTLADGDEIVFGSVEVRFFATFNKEPLSTMTL